MLCGCINLLQAGGIVKLGLGLGCCPVKGTVAVCGGWRLGRHDKGHVGKMLELGVRPLTCEGQGCSHVGMLRLEVKQT